MKTRSKTNERPIRPGPKPAIRPVEPPPVTSDELHRRLAEWYRQSTEMPHARLARTA